MRTHITGSQQFQIGLCDLVPKILLPNAIRNGAAQNALVNSSGINRIYCRSQFARSSKEHARISENLAVKWVVVRNDEVRTGHSLQQRRVRASHAVAVHVGSGVVAQCLKFLAVVDYPNKTDLVGAMREQRPYVSIGTFDIPQKDERQLDFDRSKPSIISST